MSEEKELRCSFCGEFYPLGPATGKDFTYYPQGQSKFFEHCRKSERHQKMLSLFAAELPRQLAEFGAIHKEFQRVETNRKARERRREKKREQEQA